jgi:glycosyltransferase involved in cell wall biosynthesis
MTQQSVPFFSIIIPTYNRASIIEKTVRTALQQTFQDFEIIVSDDGSTDNTKDVIASMNDPRIRYIYQENRERSAARNHGIENAKGAYICFLDSDDYYLPNHLQSLHDFIHEKAKPVSMIFTDQEYLVNGEIREAESIPLQGQDPVMYFLKNPVVPARVCIHAEILQHVRFREDIVIVEDTVLWVGIAMRFPVLHLAKHTIRYHLHDDNSVNIKKNAFLPRLRGFRLFFSDAEVRQRIPARVRMRIISDCYLGMAQHHRHVGNRAATLRNLLLSFVYQPVHYQNRMKLHMAYTVSFKPITHPSH